MIEPRIKFQSVVEELISGLERRAIRLEFETGGIEADRQASDSESTSEREP